MLLCCRYMQIGYDALSFISCSGVWQRLPKCSHDQPHSCLVLLDCLFSGRLSANTCRLLSLPGRAIEALDSVHSSGCSRALHAVSALLTLCALSDLLCPALPQAPTS